MVSTSPQRGRNSGNARQKNAGQDASVLDLSTLHFSPDEDEAHILAMFNEEVPKHQKWTASVEQLAKAPGSNGRKGVGAPATGAQQAPRIEEIAGGALQKKLKRLKRQRAEEEVYGGVVGSGDDEDGRAGTIGGAGEHAGGRNKGKKLRGAGGAAPSRAGGNTSSANNVDRGASLALEEEESDIWGGEAQKRKLTPLEQLIEERKAAAKQPMKKKRR